jgi:hypothetical protein
MSCRTKTSRSAGVSVSRSEAACGGVDEVFVLLGEVFVGEVVAAVCGDAELFECDAVVGVDAG